MADVPNASSADEPTEAEVRAYLEQLRNAGVDQVVAEVATALINAAQVKLGRSDARLLLDLVSVIADQVRGRVPDELTDQLGQALTQLRLAQVDAEKQLAQQGADTPGEGVGDAGSDPAEPAPPQPPAQSAPDGAASAKRLWTPGG